jgi:hypothetical protein
MAPFLLATASPEDQPVAALSVVREALDTFDQTGLWSELGFALRRVVMPLVRLGRYRPAALLAGGITALPYRASRAGDDVLAVSCFRTW